MGNLISVFQDSIKGQLERGQGLSLHKTYMEKTRGDGAPGELSSQYKTFFFFCKNNHSLEQPPLAHGRVPITGGFQDVIEQGGR